MVLSGYSALSKGRVLRSVSAGFLREGQEEGFPPLGGRSIEIVVVSPALGIANVCGVDLEGWSFVMVVFGIEVCGWGGGRWCEVVLRLLGDDFGR